MKMGACVPIFRELLYLIVLETTTGAIEQK